MLDACTRRVVGWSMRRTLEAEFVTSALEMALGRRRPALAYASPLESERKLEEVSIT